MTTRAAALRAPRIPLYGALRALFWATMAAGSSLILLNTLPFYSFSPTVPFLLEKAAAYADPVWRISLYVHITGGLVCLFSALPQFSRTLLRTRPGLHRAIGWTYVASVLVLVVPTGLYLALYAKGGMPGRVGFLVTGLALLYTTWRGLEHVHRRDFRGHIAWMVRSYAMAATAITFRVLYIAFHAAGTGHEYVLALWFSLFVNWGIAECVVLRHRKGVRT